VRRLWVILLLCCAAFAGAQEVQLERDVFDIAAELRCPVCRSESAADSNAGTSTEFRDIIREQLRDGQSKAQILAYFQQKYGDWILLDPPRRGVYLWVWGLPVAAGALGLGLLASFLARWRRNAAAPVEASPEDLERVRQELGRS
jgi:cytochrome c-type biogenesis protein CcmH